MKTPFARFKLTLILSLAFFLPAIWILTLSSSSLLSTFGIPALVAWAYVMSFGSAYAVTLYISALRQDLNTPPE